MKLRTLTLSALLTLGVSIPANASTPCIGAVDENGYEVCWMRGPIVKFSTEVNLASAELNKPQHLKILSDFIMTYSNNGLTKVELANLVSLVDQIARAADPTENFKMLLSKLGLIERIHSISAEIGKERPTPLWTLMPLANGAPDLLETKLVDFIDQLGCKLRDRVLNSELQRFEDKYGQRPDPEDFGSNGKWLASSEALYYVMTLDTGIADSLQRAADLLSEEFVDTAGVKWLLDPKFFSSRKRVISSLNNLGLAYFIHETSLKTEVHKDLASMMVIPKEAQLNHRDFEVEQRKKAILDHLRDAAEKRYISMVAELQSMATDDTVEPESTDESKVISELNNNNNNTPNMVVADYATPTTDGFPVVDAPAPEDNSNNGNGTLKIPVDTKELDDFLADRNDALGSELKGINEEIDQAIKETPLAGTDVSATAQKTPVAAADGVTPAAELKQILEDLKEPETLQVEPANANREGDNTEEKTDVGAGNAEVAVVPGAVDGDHTEQAGEKPSKGQKARAALKKVADTFKPKHDKKKRESKNLTTEVDKTEK